MIDLVLSEKAATQVKSMLAAEPNAEDLCLRLGIQHGGCSGFSYTLGFDTKKPGDTELQQHGVRIVVEGGSEPILSGTAIDYEEGALGGGFRIDNPNATTTCGCGASFRTEEREGKPEKC